MSHLATWFLLAWVSACSAAAATLVSKGSDWS
jgi:hypothetical protein